MGVDNIWLHSELGFCFGGLEKYQEAIKHFEKAIKMGRNDDSICAKLELCMKDKIMIKLWRFFFKGLKAEEKTVDYVVSEIAWIYNNIEIRFFKRIGIFRKS